MRREKINGVTCLVLLLLGLAAGTYAIAAVTPRYELLSHTNGDIKVLDRATNLEWTQKVESQFGFGWKDALVFCKELELFEQSDWRLPNVTELASLIDEKQPSDKAPINPYYFPDFDDSRFYWTSTTMPDVDNPDNAYAVYFNGSADEYSRGGIFVEPKGTGMGNILCVRDVD